VLDALDPAGTALGGPTARARRAQRDAVLQLFLARRHDRQRAALALVRLQRDRRAARLRQPRAHPRTARSCAASRTPPGSRGLALELVAA